MIQRLRSSLITLLFAGLLGASSAPAPFDLAAIGFPNSCPSSCERLCLGQRDSCIRLCSSRFPNDPAGLSQCQWDCSSRVGPCMDQCLLACN